MADNVTLRKKDILYQATGFTTLGSFLLMVYAVLYHDIPKENREIVVHVLGIIEGAFVGNMVNYFFGGSMAQANKEEKENESKVL